MTNKSRRKRELKYTSTVHQILIFFYAYKAKYKISLLDYFRMTLKTVTLFS